MGTSCQKVSETPIVNNLLKLYYYKIKLKSNSLFQFYPIELFVLKR